MVQHNRSRHSELDSESRLNLIRNSGLGCLDIETSLSWRLARVQHDWLRHSELDSESLPIEQGMLKQVQHDG